MDELELSTGKLVNKIEVSHNVIMQKLEVDRLKEMKEEGEIIQIAGDGKFDSPGRDTVKFSFCNIHFQDGLPRILPMYFSLYKQRRSLVCGWLTSQWYIYSFYTANGWI